SSRRSSSGRRLLSRAPLDRGSGSRGHPSAVGSLRHDQRPDDATMREALASRKRLTGSSGSPAESTPRPPSHQNTNPQSTPRRPSRLLTVATYEKRLSNGGRARPDASPTAKHLLCLDVRFVAPLERSPQREQCSIA